MSRWRPDARGRLQQAAIELYVERGFEQTTVADIAASVGLTERTFFRHFADKREVLFDGQEELLELFVSGIEGAPDAASPMDAVTAALKAVASELEPRLPWSQMRSKVVAANPGLQERELIKLARLSTAVADALRTRGVAEPAASLAAQSGIAVFHTGFAEWIAPTNIRSFSQIITDSLAALKAVVSGE